MEGFKIEPMAAPLTSDFETGVASENWAEKIKTYEKSVAQMFDEKMETSGIIRRISESPYFEPIVERK